MMEGALAWLGHIIEWFGSLIPRLRVVRSTHGGVRFRHGKDAQPIKPGLRVYWPIVTELDILPVVRQTHNLPSQSLTTKDDKTIVVSGVVVYEIRDVVSALAKNWDISDTINDITMCAITQVITSHDYAYILENITGSVQNDLTHVTRRKLKSYGIRVYRTALTDFSRALVIKNLGTPSMAVPMHNLD